MNVGRCPPALRRLSARSAPISVKRGLLERLPLRYLTFLPLNPRKPAVRGVAARFGYSHSEKSGVARRLVPHAGPKCPERVENGNRAWHRLERPSSPASSARTCRPQRLPALSGDETRHRLRGSIVSPAGAQEVRALAVRAPLCPGHHHVNLAAAAFGTDEPLAPIR
jgi:hypothetical protein